MSFGADRWSPTLVRQCLENYDELCEYVAAACIGSTWCGDASGRGAAVGYLRKVDLILTKFDFDHALSRLPLRYRRVLHLRYREHMSQWQIGRKVGCGQQWASRLIAQAEAALTEMLCREA